MVAWVCSFCTLPPHSFMTPGRFIQFQSRVSLTRLGLRFGLSATRSAICLCWDSSCHLTPYSLLARSVTLSTCSPSLTSISSCSLSPTLTFQKYSSSTPSYPLSCSLPPHHPPHLTPLSSPAHSEGSTPAPSHLTPH